jgi:hypothetical protein
MGRVMTQDLEPFLGVPGDDRNRGVLVYPGREIARLAIDPNGDCRLGEPRPNRRRYVASGDRLANSRRLPSGRVTAIGAEPARLVDPCAADWCCIVPLWKIQVGAV